jgi:hypothetical protein
MIDVAMWQELAAMKEREDRERASNPDWIPKPVQRLKERASGVLLVGDVHGQYEALNRLVRVLKPDVVLQCGDFGYWPEFPGPDGARPGDPAGKIHSDAPIHFCDGNHDDHSSLAAFRSETPKAHELAPNLFYQERGSTLDLPDGRVVLFFGGAESTDRFKRKEGETWWPGELATQRDLERLPSDPVDIIISHTSPRSLNGWSFCRSGRQKSKDPSRDILETALELMKPQKVFFGHWHDGFYGGHDSKRQLMWHCFAPIDEHYSWGWLPLKFDRRAKRKKAVFKNRHSFDRFPDLDF